MSSLQNIAAWFTDPPPELAFEIAPNRVAVCRTRTPHAPREVSVDTSDAAAFARAVQSLIPSPVKRRTCALLIPDHAVRLALLDFEKLPDKDEERLALVTFRLKKSVPFDVDQAAVAFLEQGKQVLAAAAPRETVLRYEAPFRAAGLEPGLVMCSSLAALEAVKSQGLVLWTRREGNTLTVFALRDGAILLVRVLELTPGAEDPLASVSEDLFPTLVYLEDQTGARPQKLVLAGFGAEDALRIGVELEIAVEVTDVANPGLAGYLASLGVAA